jgi:stage II sporulation protein M
MFITAIGNSLRRSSGPYLLATIIFMISFGLGALIVSTISTTGSTGPVEELPPANFPYIFTNNMRSIAILSSGMCLLGATTVLNLFLNGFALGAQLSNFLCYMPGDVAAVALLPHATLEIPGLFFAGAAGLKVPYELARYVLGRRTGATREDVYDIVLLLTVAVLLIFTAALVETYITFPMVRWYLR